MRLNKYTITVSAISIVMLAVNIISFFLLSDTIITQIFFTGKGRHTSTIIFLILMTAFIFLSSSMTFFAADKKKWTAVTIILSIINIACIAVNLF